jgi:hypothetical protein
MLEFELFEGVGDIRGPSVSMTNARAVSSPPSR